MIIYDNQSARMEMFCDELACDKSQETQGDFKEAIDAAKSRGWTVRKFDGVWKHFCVVHANEGA